MQNFRTKDYLALYLQITFQTFIFTLPALYLMGGTTGLFGLEKYSFYTVVVMIMLVLIIKIIISQRYKILIMFSSMNNVEYKRLERYRYLLSFGIVIVYVFLHNIPLHITHLIMMYALVMYNLRKTDNLTNVETDVISKSDYVAVRKIQLICYYIILAVVITMVVLNQISNLNVYLFYIFVGLFIIISLIFSAIASRKLVK